MKCRGISFFFPPPLWIVQFPPLCRPSLFKILSVLQTKCLSDCWTVSETMLWGSASNNICNFLKKIRCWLHSVIDRPAVCRCESWQDSNFYFKLTFFILHTFLTCFSYTQLSRHFSSERLSITFSFFVKFIVVLVGFADCDVFHPVHSNHFWLKTWSDQHIVQITLF